MAAITSLVLAGVGAGLSAYGQIQQGKTAKAIGNYNAAINDQNAQETANTAAYNAALAEQDALQVEMDARENIVRKRAENKRYQGAQRARFAKAGVTEEGSPLEVMAETAALLEMDAQEINRQASINAARIRSGGAETLRQGKFASNQYKAQAGLDRTYGAAASQASKIGAASTLLSGAGKIAGSAYTFRQQGAN